jgi:hypothetical protein
VTQSGHSAPDTLCRAGHSRLQFCASQAELDANQIEMRLDREEQIRMLHRNREQVDCPVDARKVRFEAGNFRGRNILCE